MTVVQGASGKFVNLNVGGTVFKTTLATLQGGSSMLSKMFSGQMEPGLRDEQGRVYIDRSPKHFGIVLDCLRCGGIAEAAAALLPTSREEQRQLMLEAQYYGCEGLVEALEAAEQEWAHREGWEEKRQQAAAVTEAARAALVEEAQDKAEAAAATLQEALGELQALEQEAEQVAAAAQAVPADARLEHEQAAGRLIASAVDAEERGSKAANQRFLAQSMCLAALSGGAEPAALALWQEEKAAAERQLHDAVHAVHLVLRRLHDGNQPPPLNNFGSDSDDDEEAERFRRFMAQANRREAGGGMGQLDLERQLEQQARLFMEQQGVAEGLLPQLLQWEDAPGAAGEEEEEEEEEGPPPVAGV